METSAVVTFCNPTVDTVKYSSPSKMASSTIITENVYTIGSEDIQKLRVAYFSFLVRLSLMLYLLWVWLLAQEEGCNPLYNEEYAIVYFFTLYFRINAI